MDQNSEKEHYLLAPVEASEHCETTPGASNQMENFPQELEKRSWLPLALHVYGEIAGYTENEHTKAEDTINRNHLFIQNEP